MPDDAWGLCVWARLKTQDRKWDEGIDGYSRAIKLYLLGKYGDIDTGSSQLRNALAETYNRLGMVIWLKSVRRDEPDILVAAMDAYQSAVSLDEHYADAWYGIGLIYRRLGQIQDARSAFQTAALLDPSDETFADVIERFDELDAEFLFMRAEELQLDGMRDNANKVLDEGLMLKGDHFWGVSIKSQLLWRSGKHEESFETACRAIDLINSIKSKHELNSRAEYYLCRMCHVVGSWNEILAERSRGSNRSKHYALALAAYQRAIALENYDAEAVFRSGICNWHLGFRKEAVQDFDRAVMQMPNYMALYFDLVGAALVNGQFRKAFGAMRKIWELAKRESKGERLDARRDAAVLRSRLIADITDR